MLPLNANAMGRRIHGPNSNNLTVKGRVARIALVQGLGNTCSRNPSELSLLRDHWEVGWG